MAKGTEHAGGEADGGRRAESLLSGAVAVLLIVGKAGSPESSPCTCLLLSLQIKVLGEFSLC